ncbi:nuclear transport factor 2 family protein [Nocardia thraciensis]
MTRANNLQTINQWLDLYNNDIHRLIDEFYTEEFVVLCPGLLEIKDRRTFHEVEQSVLDAAPDRRMRITRTITSGDDVIIEAVLYGQHEDGTGWESPLCEIFTLVDGKVAREHAYIDAATWPGLPTST